MIYVFDGSMEGLLCAVFEWFERKPGKIVLKAEYIHQPDAFSATFEVQNDAAKADRVWKGLQKKLDRTWMRRWYCAYLSERSEAYSALFEFTCYLFSSSEEVEKNYGHPQVLSVAQTARKVEREKHRMEAFIRFQHTSDGIYYCGIDPDFNVLPLIMKHFKDRYADQQWIIYDIKRKYGLYYDLEKVEEIHMDFDIQVNQSKVPVHAASDQESLYTQLWTDYFKSINIPARKNTKLHLQHVPRRYWKYLTEKQYDVNL